MPGNRTPEREKDAPEHEETPSEAESSPEAPKEKTEAQPQPEDTQAMIKRNEELLSRLMYLQAEFENYQKRALRERQEIIANAQEGLMRSLLPILDDLDKAVEVVGEGDSGLSMLKAKLLKTLEENGLREIPAKGERFDPFVHDAVEFAEDGALEHGTIKEVIRKGYRCNAKVLRPSLVTVVKNEHVPKNEGEKNA